MSRHEGVSCDSCLKGNFRGRRYKCLTCYDYDLCANCYEADTTTTRHTIDHPMQCILTHSDFDLYYGGETLSSEQQQSFTCPFCGKMGYTEVSLQEHVTNDHSDASNEVVCPVCAAMPGGEPNLITEDFVNHLSVAHGTRDLISFLDDPTGSRAVRRMPHPTRSIGASRTRRSNMHFTSSGAITSVSPSATRDNVDPIAELLSQLSGVRRSNTAQGSSASAQLQQLQMQLQLERQQVRAARQQLERLPRRQAQITSAAANSHTNAVLASLNNHSSSSSSSNNGNNNNNRGTTNVDTISAARAITHVQTHPHLILSKLVDYCPPEIELQTSEVERADRSLFMKEILLTVLTDKKEESKPRKTRVTLTRQTPAAISQSPPKSVEQPITACKRSQNKASSQIQRSSQHHQPIQAHQPNNQPAPQSRTTPPHPTRVVHSGNIVLVGSNFGTDTSRRKPLLDSINKTSEPPTSH